MTCPYLDAATPLFDRQGRRQSLVTSSSTIYLGRKKTTDPSLSGMPSPSDHCADRNRSMVRTLVSTWEKAESCDLVSEHLQESVTT